MSASRDPADADAAAAGRGTRTALSLLSGGLDSAVATAMWIDRGGRIAECLWCDYGQRARGNERRAAQRFCRDRGLSLREVELPWLAELAAAAGSALAPGGPEPPPGTAEHPGDATTAAAVWVPARNCVLLAVAAAFAEVAGAGVVLAGFNREEAATFPDNSEPFARAATAFLQLGTSNGVAVQSPTQPFDKVAIVRAARRLGIGPQDVWSCYRGGDAPCGRCESCARSARAWRNIDGDAGASGPAPTG